MSDTEVNNIINMESYGDEPRTRPFSKRRSEEGYMAEKMHDLFRRQAGHISVLTNIYNEILKLITREKSQLIEKKVWKLGAWPNYVIVLCHVTIRVHRKAIL